MAASIRRKVKCPSSGRRLNEVIEHKDTHHVLSISITRLRRYRHVALPSVRSSDMFPHVGRLATVCQILAISFPCLFCDAHAYRRNGKLVLSHGTTMPLPEALCISAPKTQACIALPIEKEATSNGCEAQTVLPATGHDPVGPDAATCPLDRAGFHAGTCCWPWCGGAAGCSVFEIGVALHGN